VPTGDALVDRLLSLRQHQSDGRRSPHKPLLVLLALGRLAESGSSALEWSVAEDRLASLIAEFGPSSKTGRAQSAAYPFTRLRSDGVWRLSRDVPMDAVAPLAEAPVTGGFVPGLEDALRRDPDLLRSVARELVDSQFPETLAQDVLLAVGLDPQWVAGGLAAEPPGEARQRSAAWRESILRAWDARCAFCGFDGAIAGAPVGIEAAHVRWFNFDGPDAPDNGLALCALDHKLFDRGAVGLTPDGRIEVSQAFRAAGPAGRAVYARHGLRLDPRPGTALPAEPYVDWHRSEVFKGEPLAG